MNPQNNVLVRVLAQTDGLWLPMRQADWYRSVPAVLYEARQRYRTAGVLHRPSDPSASGRQAEGRMLAAMADDGLLVLTTPDTRRTDVRLTCRGDQYARALCGLPGVRQTLDALTIIARIRGGHGEASEVHPSLMTRRGGYAHRDAASLLGVLQDILLPALVRGWCQSASDCEGRVRYRLTLPEVLTADPVSDLPAADPDATDRYYRLRQASRGRLRHQDPEVPSCLGVIPLAVTAPDQSPWAWSDPS